MHGQGNYTIQVGQDPYVRPPAFQQQPAASTTPATSHYGPLAPQPQVIQHVRPSFHPTRGIAAYQHAIPSVQHQGPPVPVVSGGLSSTQSYFSRPPLISTQISHSYPTSDQQPLPWSQNIHQLPASAPLSRPSAYQLPSSQGPPHQPPSHAIPSQLPPYSSSSGALMSDPFGSSVLPMREHSHQQPMVSVLPPPPPPLPCSSPPGVPPLPPSSPSSDILSKRGGGCSLKVPFDGNNLMMERPPPGKPAEDRSAYEADVPVQHSEKNGLKVGSEDALVVHSPTDSDMDMEDDITHPDEEKKNCLSSNSYGECVSKFQEDYGKEQLQLLQHAGGHRLPEIALHGNPLIAKVSVSKTQIGGSEIASDCKFHLTTKVTSEADDSGTLKDGQTRHPLDVTVEQSVSQHKNISEPNVPVLYSETGYRQLSDQEMEGANPFKLLQGYASNNTSENEEENLLRNVGSCSANDGSTNSDADKGCDFGSELRDKMQADKLSFATGVVEEISDRSHGGRESASILTDARHRNDSRNYDDNTGLEGANLHKSDMKSYSNKLNVDEFGRLVREGVSDSDASDSPRYARRHARRARKRSRSRSRSQSPHDRRRRRRRSPWRRKERRSRSRSLSPKRRRSKSRSPVIRRDSEFGGDKPRRERGQLPECFDFLRGKCYRGATCRYSHHESDKSERLRYNRGKQHYRDMPPSLQSPDFQESKVLPDKEMKDKVLRLPQDMPGSREAKDAKRLPVESITEFPSKLDSRESGSLLAADVLAGNRSGYSAHDMPSGEDKSLVSEFAVQYSDEIPQTVDPQVKRTDDILVPESSTPPQALAATSTRHPADKSVGSLAKPYASEEVSCQSSKELLPSNANRPSQLTLPLPSALQGASAPVAQPIAQDYNSKPSLSWNNLTPENYSPCEAPAAYQHSHFPGPLKSLPSSFLPPPPPPPPPTTAGHSISSQQIQQSLLPPWNGLSSYASMQAQPTELPNPSLTGGYQAYPLARGPDQMLHSTDGFGSSSLHPSNQTGQQGGPHVMGEDRLTGHSVQVTNPSLSQGQSNILLIQSASKGMHGSIGGGLPSDSNSLSRTYFQQASYGPQYSGAGGVVAVQHAEPGMVGSSASRITADFLERNHSYVRDIVESRVSNYFNPYAPNLPQSSKFSSDALTHEHDTTINTRYGAQVGLSTAPLDTHEIASLGSKNISVFPRPGGDQYDPLFDSIEPASNSFSKADHQKHETTGDSDDVLKFGGSGRVLTMEGTKMEGGTAASANDSLENEEYGETADVAVDAVLNGTPSNPNDATEMNAGEFEIDQVKTSGKKKSKERSMKLFKVSIATFVKEVLKPSWRQGNMSKEAFKTIVKKTVDKVSGAMKSHQIPKSQAKINHYIDSSRGKLTKLVMGYVDKYVKV